MNNELSQRFFNDCPTTVEFLKHIFGNEYERGLQYIRAIINGQKAPILFLQSKENTTGKTTFIKWLKSIFRNELSIVTVAQLESMVDYAYQPKTLVCCDEVFISRQLFDERIKSTYVNGTSIKFILTSNNEDIISESNNDVWVIKPSKPNVYYNNFFESLISEIPSFILYIYHSTTHNS
jgi:hypothetical protein